MFALALALTRVPRLVAIAVALVVLIALTLVVAHPALADTYGYYWRP
jgi:hypothetical protein